ncbi:Nicotinic acetylcholine receptor alpha7 [Daphnia magna]|uniref:Nicotinic acetylcholine receptor alpha7 n=1 Tax=Daphnia magna TaxID=35525 RepID=A0A162SI47_9CRUS|nr:Nicotinic acetylcholine receptor alpha7 [Daphnia magna]
MRPFSGSSPALLEALLFFFFLDSASPRLSFELFFFLFFCLCVYVWIVCSKLDALLSIAWPKFVNVICIPSVIPSKATKVTSNGVPMIKQKTLGIDLDKIINLDLIILFYVFSTGCQSGPNEKRLLTNLLDKYNTLERPVFNESEPVVVSFGLTLMQIIDVDEKNQILTTNAWLNLDWRDQNLIWNPANYSGVKDVRIPPNRIWKPDILLYNSADEGFDNTFQTNVVVRHNGSCNYIPPGIFKSTCKIDITWFPFDDQQCKMKFGSWTYDGFMLDLVEKTTDGGDISGFITNGEWDLIGVPSNRTVEYYTCCPEPYVDITFTIHIRRRTLYYFFNLIVPSVLISSMALLGFTLPPDSGEKLTLGVTILLSLTVFLNLVAETLPQVSDAIPLLGNTITILIFSYFFSDGISLRSALLSFIIRHSNLALDKLLHITTEQGKPPIEQVDCSIITKEDKASFVKHLLTCLTQLANVQHEQRTMYTKVKRLYPINGLPSMITITDITKLICLGTYFNCIMFMVASSVVLTVVVLNYHHRRAEMHDMPGWVRTLFLLWLPWILRMSRPGKKVTRKTILMNSRIKEMELKERSSRSLLANVLDMDDDFRSASGISYAPTYTSNLTNRYGSSGGVGSGLGGVGGNGGRGVIIGGPGGGGVGPGNSSTLPHFPTSASYHQQQHAPVGQQQSSGHLAESSLAHGNMISANAQSSTFGSRAGGFAIDEDSPSTPYCIQAQRDLQAIIRELRFITSKLKKKDDENDLIAEWKFAAMVVDRICLFIFTMFTIIATLAVLFSAPHIIVQ